MKTPANISEAMDQLEKVAHYFLSHIHAQGKIPTIKRGGDLGEVEETDSDLHLEIEGWICITPFHATEEHECISGTRKSHEIHYSIQREEIVHGVYRRRDGSGEPDTVDIVEVKLDKPLTSPTQAIAYACKMMFDNELDFIAESFYENEMIEDEEKWEIAETKVIGRNVEEDILDDNFSEYIGFEKCLESGQHLKSCDGDGLSNS